MTTRLGPAFDSFVPPNDPFGTDPLMPSGVDAMFTVVPVLIGIGIVVTIVLAIRRGVRCTQHGIDPTVADVDLTAELLKSDLLASGTVSTEEHAAARAKVLEDV